MKTVGKAKLEGNQIKIPGAIEFDTDKATIKNTPQTNEILDTMAKVMKENPKIEGLRIEGHTDNTGTEARNNTLSQERAEAVVKWLVDHGVDKSRLQGVGHGQKRPIADNSTKDGKDKNRRVEFHVSKMDGKEVPESSPTSSTAPASSGSAAPASSGSAAPASSGSAKPAASASAAPKK